MRTRFGDAYAELYLAPAAESFRVALTGVGTCVIEDISTSPGLETGPDPRHPPWRHPRRALRRAHRSAAAARGEGQGPDRSAAGAEEEQASQQSLRGCAPQRAFREALLTPRPEETTGSTFRPAATAKVPARAGRGRGKGSRTVKPSSWLSPNGRGADGRAVAGDGEMDGLDAGRRASPPA